MYGLKQSGRNWHNLLQYFLIKTGFVKSDADPCVFVKTDEAGSIILLVWVDDIILAVTSDEVMNDIKKVLKDRFDMKDLGPISFFLGIQFIHKEKKIIMNQSRYLSNVLRRFDMEACKPRSTPCEINPSSYDTEECIDEPKYRELVSSLVFAMTCTRPDLCYVVTKLSQHLSCPNKGDWVMLKHVFRYVKGTIDYGLCYKQCANDLKFLAFCDSDWASSTKDRRSITGYCFSLTEDGPVVSWKTRKQVSVALSTCEAEYMALSATYQEAIYIFYVY